MVHLEHLDEKRQEVIADLEITKNCVKAHYDEYVCPLIFNEGDLVLLYDQDSEPLGVGKFKPMWHGPYVVKCVLEKGAYEIEYYKWNSLEDPRNGIYLKKYYVLPSVEADILHITVHFA